MKYIIKNCPNFIAEYMFFDPCKCEKSNSINGVYQGYCKDINDCPLKRIVELCNRYQLRCKVCPTHDVCFECESVSGKQLSDEFLNLLEIEKINEK